MSVVELPDSAVDSVATMSDATSRWWRRRDARASDDVSDEHLISAIARGSETALAKTYQRYGAAVHGTSMSVLKDWSLAEDITQAVFVALWDRPERFDPARGSLRALLTSMAHHRSIDRLRSDSARDRREERDAKGRRLAAVPDPVGDEVWSDFSRAAVSAALDRLDADQREAIELAYFGGLTYREVAARLDVPEGTIKSRIKRGLERLRASLESESLL